MSHFFEYDPDDIDVQFAELMTATHDHVDPMVHPKVTEALGLMRRHLDMDVMFVSQFRDRKRTFRVVEAGHGFTKVAAGHSDPLEESWCQFVVDGRAPRLIKDAAPLVASGTLPAVDIPIGSHLSTPIRLKNGSVYGTLCCFSHGVKEDLSEKQLRRLQAAAKVLGDDLSRTSLGADLELSPLDPPGRPR
jgi:hypothetical protein